MACEIFSRLNYSVSVPYGDTSIQIPARVTKFYIPEEKKLGALPDGITAVKIKEAK